MAVRAHKGLGKGTGPKATTPLKRGRTLKQVGPIAAAKAKAQILQIMDQVSQDGVPLVITKRGTPFVQIAPLDAAFSGGDPFGCMHGTVTINGDIVEPEPDVWEALE